MCIHKQIGLRARKTDCYALRLYIGIILDLIGVCFYSAILLKVETAVRPSLSDVNGSKQLNLSTHVLLHRVVIPLF